MTPFIAGCCQFEVTPGDVERNLEKVEKSFPDFKGKGCGLLVLPEMWSSGFDYPSLTRIAKKTPAVIDILSEWARRYNMVLVGSLPELDDGTVYNTSYVIDSDGRLKGQYRKVHLFSLSREDDHFGRGVSPLVCSTTLGKIGVMICYDLRFPELARRLALDGAEILCISAQWPVSRIDHWSLLLRARAVENQLFAVGCNGCGKEGKLHYGGTSAIISPTAIVLAEAGPREERLCATVDPDETTGFRKLIDCFSDRVPEVYAGVS
jgi:omega-amidase